MDRSRLVLGQYEPYRMVGVRFHSIIVLVVAKWIAMHKRLVPGVAIYRSMLMAVISQ